MISNRSQLAAVTAAIQAMADNRCPSSKAEREIIRQHLTAVRERIERNMAAKEKAARTQAAENGQ